MEDFLVGIHPLMLPTRAQIRALGGASNLDIALAVNGPVEMIRSSLLAGTPRTVAEAQAMTTTHKTSLGTGHQAG